MGDPSPALPEAEAGGRPRKDDLREVMNALPYQDRTGCQWELLPRDLLPRRIAQDDHADQKFENARLKGWLAARGDPFRRELVRRPEGSGGFVKRRLAADDKRPIG